MSVPVEWLTRLLVVGLVGFGVWGLVLVTVSLSSETPRLALGEEKSIGFFDPHLHLSVVDVTAVDDGAGLGLAARPRWHHLLVTVKARNDASVIDIDPSFLRVEILDAAGRTYRPLLRAAKEGVRGLEERLSRSLAPDDAFTQTFLFELPRDAREPSLWIRDPHWLARLLPGSETSFLHGRVMFELGP